MNRLFWLEFIDIIFSFLLLINGFSLIGIMTLIIGTLIIYLFLDKIELFRVIFITLVTYLLMNYLVSSGQLNECIEYIDLFILVLSINISSEYELLAFRKETSFIIKPFICAVIFLLSLSLLTIFNYDNNFIINIYPKGIISIFSLINIIFMPYISCLTLSFIIHEYNN